MTKKIRRAKARRALLALSLMLVTMVVAVGGTIAWLTAETKSVTNTFTTSDIDIVLKEDNTEATETPVNKEFEMVPGKVLTKDPTVTVKGGSEDCYVFVKVEESENLDNFIDYGILDAWKLVEGTTNVYWQKVANIEEDVTFNIIHNNATDTDPVVNKVTVKSDVTKEDMEALTETTYPTLKFTAYASQLMNDTTEFTPEQAWTNVVGE